MQRFLSNSPLRHFSLRQDKADRTDSLNYYEEYIDEPAVALDVLIVDKFRLVVEGGSYKDMQNLLRQGCDT